MKINEAVEQVLKEYPEARDDDFILCVRTYIRLGFAKNIKDKIQIDLTNPDFKFRPSFETITRIRRIIQNNEKRLRATPETELRRLNHEIRIHTNFSTKNMNPFTYPSNFY